MDSGMAEKLSDRSHRVQGEHVLSIYVEANAKLLALGGGRDVPLKTFYAKARERLSRVRPKYWRSLQCVGRLKRFRYGEQLLSADEIQDINAAYAAMCPEEIKKNQMANAGLLHEFLRFVEIASVQDAEFFAAQIEGMRQHLSALGIAVPGTRHQD